jgi:hypothetical protein
MGVAIIMSTVLLYTPNMQSKDANIQEEITTISQKEPYILVIGQPGGMAEYLIIFEGTVIFEEEEFLKSIILLFAVYYNFNVVYVRSLHPILFFFQEHIFKLGQTKHKPQSLVNFLQATYDL